VSNTKFGTKYRVTRGGSFRGKSEDVRTTRRDYAEPAYKTTPESVQAKQSSLIGFRCAVSADDPKLKAHLQQTKK
jgi:formylglycine-generating enzyme required for sulfatase activity